MESSTVLRTSSSDEREFAFRYDRWCGWLLGLLGIGRRWSRIRLDADSLDVRMGWSFRATIPRPSIRRTAEHDGIVLGWGVHGWRGRWLVNGSSKGIAVVTIEPPARAWVLGIPIRLRELAVSLEDRDAFRAALGC